MGLLSSHRPLRLAIAGLSFVLPACLNASATVIPVSTVGQLQSALASARAGDEIVVAAGTYSLSSDLWMNYPGVVLRGATGNRDDVFLRGPGMNNTASSRIPVHINAANCTVQDLSVGECYWHGIQIHDPADYCVIRNVKTINCGEQHIKSVPSTTGGLIELCLMDQTYVRTNDGVDRPNDYLGGIDLHAATNWIIRDNLIRNITGANLDGDAGIFVWNQSVNCLTERNVVIGCNKGIAYGNPYNGGTAYHMTGGTVRNNFVYAKTSAGADIGMEMCFVRDVKVYNNTIWTDSGSFFRTFQFNDSAATPNTNVQLRYNIIRGNFNDFTGGKYSSVGDIIGNVAQASWFVNPAGGDYHLTKLATAAIDQAAALPEVPEDYDRQARPSRGAPDVGADEFLWGDITGDNRCNVFDLQRLAASWNKQLGQPGYDAACDLNGDNKVNVFDLQVMAGDWNK